MNSIGWFQISSFETKINQIAVIQYITNYSKFLCQGISDRDRIRTCDRLLRRQMLYPAELRDLCIIINISFHVLCDRPANGGMLYPAELRDLCIIINISFQYSVTVPPTAGCSIQLSYATFVLLSIFPFTTLPDRPANGGMLYPAELRDLCIIINISFQYL